MASETRQPEAYRVERRAFAAVVDLLAGLPYGRVARVMKLLEQEATPIYPGSPSTTDGRQRLADKVGGPAEDDQHVGNDEGSGDGGEAGT